MDLHSHPLWWLMTLKCPRRQGWFPAGFVYACVADFPRCVSKPAGQQRNKSVSRISVAQANTSPHSMALGEFPHDNAVEETSQASWSRGKNRKMLANPTAPTCSACSATRIYKRTNPGAQHGPESPNAASICEGRRCNLRLKFWCWESGTGTASAGVCLSLSEWPELSGPRSIVFWIVFLIYEQIKTVEGLTRRTSWTKLLNATRTWYVTNDVFEYFDWFWMCVFS